MRKKTSPIIAIALVAAALAAAYLFMRGEREPEPEPEGGPVAGKLVVHFLDIGQGDAELIQLPDGKFILIDSGDRGAATVDLLKQYGVRELELAIATHPHADHIGEMRDVMREIKVKEIWDSGFPHPTKTYADMLQEIKKQGIKFSTPKRGESRQFGHALIEVVHPGTEPIDDNANNGSLTIRLTFGNNRFLFTGDSEEKAWEQMFVTTKDKLRADVLKAAHHGSSNGINQQVLDAVRPAIVTISCRAGNDYHHPHPRVVDLLERQKGAISIYRTDLQGTITATSDGQKINVTTQKQVAENQLYLTGDEVAGNTAGNGRGEDGSPKKRSARGGR